MSRNILEKWQDLNTVSIPPIEKKGFSSRVLERKLWEKTRTRESATEEQTQTERDSAKVDMVLKEPVSEQTLEEQGEDQTTLLLNSQEVSDEKTSLLIEESEANPKAYMIRISTNERINIERDGFVIGKSSKADYRIHGNDAISREHIRINMDGCRFLLEDLDSLNKTYVNGEEIHAPVEMENGQIFKMADEEFCFYIEKEENH